MTLSSRVVAVLVAAVALAAAVPVRAQSLADVARKEEERRQQVKQPAKVYTNKDLQPAPSSSTPQPAAATDSASPAADASAAKDDGPKPAASNDKSGKTNDSKEPTKDHAYWAGRLKELQTTLDRDQTFADALQTKINALTTDFVNRDDPAQRAGIERDRQKALAELDRLKKQIVADKKAIDDFQEEARRAGVPPGWLRS